MNGHLRNENVWLRVYAHRHQISNYWTICDCVSFLTWTCTGQTLTTKRYSRVSRHDTPLFLLLLLFFLALAPIIAISFSRTIQLALTKRYSRAGRHDTLRFLLLLSPKLPFRVIYYFLTTMLALHSLLFCLPTSFFFLNWDEYDSNSSFQPGPMQENIVTYNASIMMFGALYRVVNKCTVRFQTESLRSHL